MRFYKILKQRKKKEESIFNILKMKNLEFIKGNHSNSFAIKYNPESYNKLLNDSMFFREFKSRAIQQLFVTNQKYLAILNYDDFFNMEMVDCLFVEEDEGSMYLEELDELTLESIKYIVERYSLNIKEVTFITKESKRSIVLMKNGVIGVDNGLTKSEHQKLQVFIDTLNLGLKVIRK
ncbi:hypothetical protein HW35_13775 [Bacillus sp. X1(2014)]|nr:hypothetical protein HW35_13775 [Bacillus sp. X1(2014)]